ncbi:hypothetical protein OIU77_031479 [Salix suchowensis]|uniref:Uncharacterized protein n=1 Tax=Salix suchowensis TaxID=1278906 RepID=A0ABQ9BFK4_9ROSI|nr:hypothetical protein OIU77_031479 [Salix suchowensis]
MLSAVAEAHGTANMRMTSRLSPPPLPMLPQVFQERNRTRQRLVLLIMQGKKTGIIKSLNVEGEKGRVKARNGKSEKLSDLLSMAEAESESETRKKVEVLEGMKRVVRELQVDEGVKRREAACNVRLLCKEDAKARVTLSMVGAIPPLVGMLDLEDFECQIDALYALLNLGIGNDVNKAAIVKAGAVHKMLKIIESPNAANPSVSEAIVANFLGLSALDLNKPIIGSSGAVPFLVNSLKDLDRKNGSQAKQDALRALYNLSISPSNISFILETDLITFLMGFAGRYGSK